MSRPAVILSGLALLASAALTDAQSLSSADTARGLRSQFGRLFEMPAPPPVVATHTTSAPASAKHAQTAPVPGGILIRSDGTRTIWRNGQILRDRNVGCVSATRITATECLP